MSLASMLAFGWAVFRFMYAQQRFGVLCAAPTPPCVSTAIRPMEFLMRSLWLTRVMEFWAASCADWPLCIWSQAYLARTRRMATSPMPVVEQAPAWLSAYVPLPISGVSPILPGSFSAKPPVDVAAAVLPSLSKATAPTVSIWKSSGCAEISFRSFGRLSISLFLSLFVSCFQ